MIPRTEMVCFFAEDSFEENLDVIKEGQFTRYPVAEEDKDHIRGLVNIKEIFTGHIHKDQETLDAYIRPILHITEATPIKQVLIQMQKERIHMAIVIDEYGGTAGLLTVEDILEEIVGDIRDEFDTNEKLMIEEIDDTTTLLDGKVLLDEVNELFGIDLEDDKVDTVGGWIITHNLDAEKGTIIDFGSYQFIVE